MMRGARWRIQHDRQHGFTLVELLVVIIILGILSAVVVFAVRGSGDKGDAAARATDKRIIRTAMETFCATYGRYAASMDELANGPFNDPDNPAAGRKGPGFLSEESTYNATMDVSGPTPTNGCGSYSLDTVENPMCDQLVNGVVAPVETQPGMWCMGASPLKGVDPFIGKNMVRLADGKIFTGMEVYDPADGPKGSWKQAPQNLLAASRYPDGCPSSTAEDRPFGSICPPQAPAAMVTIGGQDQDPAKDLCGQNCGKVLTFTAYFGAPAGGGQWELYDPLGSGSPGRVGSWTRVRENPTGGHRTRAVQILASNPSDCGLNCGKVLMMHSPRFDLAELWDPKTGNFTPVVKAAGVEERLMEALPRGQVLILGGNLATGGGLASIFDPLTTTFVPIPAPRWRHPDVSDETQAVSDGRAVMVSSNFNSTLTGITTDIEIFTPSELGVGGVWTDTKTCGEDAYHPSTTFERGQPGSKPLERYCHLLSGLPGGGVLAWSSRITERTQPFGRTYAWYPGDTQWRRTGDFNTQNEFRQILPPQKPSDPEMPTGGILLSAPGCGENCGKVLAVNRQQGYRSDLQPPPDLHAVVSELYTPSPPAPP